MFKILGEYYYIDLDAIDEFTRIYGKQSTDGEEDSDESQEKVHIVKDLEYQLEKLTN